MTIALMRHGQTDWNLVGRVQGHTNIPLNDTGRAQAREAAEMLVEQGRNWSLITSSPLDRARETAEIIATRLGISLASPIDSLIEQRYGEAEGVSVAELETRWPNRDFKFGETSEEVAERGLRTIEEIWETHAGNPVLAVTHGAFIRRLIATISGVQYVEAPRILNATVTTFERTTQGAWIITTINSEPTSNGATPVAEPATETPAPSFVALGDSGAGFCTIDGVCN